VCEEDLRRPLRRSGEHARPINKVLEEDDVLNKTDVTRDRGQAAHTPPDEYDQINDPSNLQVHRGNHKTSSLKLPRHESDAGEHRGALSGIASFARSLSGEVVLPGDERYAALRRVKNQVINDYPAFIVRCANYKDVQLAVDFARDKGLLTAVRSGGHSFAGHGVCEGGMVIDLSNMKRVQIDPVHEKVRIEPGVLAGELDCLTQAFRMAVPPRLMSDRRRGGIFPWWR
jgi:hypothetical protein